MTTVTNNICTVQTPRISVFKFLKAMISTQRQRRQLAKLDANALDDLGLCRAEVSREIQKPFWDVPAHWTK